MRGWRRLLAPDIEPGAGDSPLPQRRFERRLVVDETARGGDEISGRLHQCIFARADHGAGLLGQRAIDRDEIGVAQKFVEFDLARATFTRLLGVDVGVVSEDLDAEQAAAEFGDVPAYIADADDANGLAMRLAADEIAAVGQR